MTHLLPSKLPQYLVRLHAMYDRKGHKDMRDAIAACRFYVREGVNYDNWNGGTWGHDVLFFLPLEELAKIDIEEQRDIASGVCQLLNKMAEVVEGEWFNAVSFEMIDENDAECQKARSFSQTAPVNPDTLSFWKPGLARVFISHRDGHKAQARELSRALEEYGISCFVAHDTIQPMSEWRTEIMKGLQTMEVMLVFLTDDFSESMWCHQEVGFALGKGVPIVSLKLGQKDPPGFISHVQAQRGKVDKPSQSASDLFPLIGKALGRQERLHEILIGSFLTAPNYIDAKARFERMADSVDKLSETHCERIITAFRSNDQLYNSMYLVNKSNRLKKFLERTTGRDFEINGRDIKEMKAEANLDDVPF